MSWQDQVTAAWGVVVPGLRRSGGSASVYEGFQTDLERPVALKVIETVSAQSELHDRFRREARIVAQMAHPSIVPLFNFSVFDGAMVIMMPWYDSSLADLIATRQVTPPEVRQIYEQVGGALAHAHAHGVVHRDVKPSNIMIASDGRFVLTDFGIATGSQDTRITRTGAIPGTPDYLAPEVIQGQQPSPAADLYALGATMFEAAAGTKPFAAESAVSAAYMHVHGSIPDLEIPSDPALALLIRKLMAKDPDIRNAPGSEPGPTQPPRRARLIRWLVAGALGLTALAFAWISALGSDSRVQHAKTVVGKLIDTQLIEVPGCPSQEQRADMGFTGERADVTRVGTWRLAPLPVKDISINIGEISSQGALTKSGLVTATVPPTSANAGSITYKTADGVVHEHPVTIPHAVWLDFDVETLAGSAAGTRRATASLQDGDLRPEPLLASPSSLGRGPQGNSSVLLKFSAPARVLYMGAAIDRGSADTSEPFDGVAYARLCESLPCGQAGTSDPLLLTRSLNPGLNASLSPAQEASYARFVWQAGNGRTDTRLLEACLIGTIN